MRMIQKSETNNAIVVALENVRSHPNADRLQLATVLGTQVVVGLEAKSGDVVVYFDANLCLSPEYLKANNLYSNAELNADPTKKGYFGKHGRVKAQRFRGEVSNGYVADLTSIAVIEAVRDGEHWNYDMIADDILHLGDEFTHVGGVKICEKYVPPQSGGYCRAGNKQANKDALDSDTFWKHWDTKQLMREKHRIGSGVLWIEEKIHGTSGRTGRVLCRTHRPFWKFWAPKEEWRVVSGTRRVDSVRSHLSVIRREVEAKVASHLHKGEQLYYEIFGTDKNGAGIQTGYTYGCSSGQYRVILYRVTITTPDGLCVDLPRPRVYKRAEELGLETPPRLWCGYRDHEGLPKIEDLLHFADGRSILDVNTLREGIVVWFMDSSGRWDCLKHKSDEFLMAESRQKDEGGCDVEDVL